MYARLRVSSGVNIGSLPRVAMPVSVFAPLPALLPALITAPKAPSPFNVAPNGGPTYGAAYSASPATPKPCNPASK